MELKTGPAAGMFNLLTVWQTFSSVSFIVENWTVKLPEKKIIISQCCQSEDSVIDAFLAVLRLQRGPVCLEEGGQILGDCCPQKEAGQFSECDAAGP